MCGFAKRHSAQCHSADCWGAKDVPVDIVPDSLDIGVEDVGSIFAHLEENHRYQKSLSRLLKVCYVPATSAILVAYFSSFLLRPLTVLMKQTRQPVCTVKQSIYLDVYEENKNM
jgi:hypothetical protein